MKSYVVILLMSLLFLACSKDDASGGDAPAPQPIPGMGETGGELQGAAFSLPTGITLEGQLTGEGLTPVCKELGTGYYVVVYCKLKNTGTQAIKVSFPTGLVLKSLSVDDQSGLVVQHVETTIAAGAVCIVQLNTYCANASRGSSSSTSRYSFGPVTNAPSLVYLMERLKNKNLADHEGTAQSLVWMCTDQTETGLSTEEFWQAAQAQIDMIPNN